MDEAIIYQITPYSFVKDGTFDAITAKLHELKSLGINTIWLQPVFKSFYGGQGYDVTDYLSLNPDIGTEKQLQNLIDTAKALKMRVLFDVVLNHTSIHHPYGKDRIKYGIKSHYYNFYQHKNGGKPYSSFYNSDEYGFINYFWEHLVNLNYQNKEVQRWMLEVCKYWVRKFDIDGYRFDAIWGVNARMPSFAKRLRTELKSIKPDVLLLAEDKGSVPEVFELGFDAAYDWTADTSWVSQWSWEYEYHVRKSATIFNFPNANERGKMLSQALFHNGGNAHRKLRFIENNDLPRFIKEHQLERTKMAAALLFSLPGIPMLYNGQEIGVRGHPYSSGAVFHRDSSIQSLDEEGLFSYYQKLIKMRMQYPALSDTAMRELSGSSEGGMVAFHRWKDNENFIIIVNMDDTNADATIDIKEVTLDSPSRKYRLKDILAGKIFKPQKDSQVKIPMEEYSVRWLKLNK
jgi:cyclomaltodextrinase